MIGGATDLDLILELIVKRGRALIRARSLLILLREGDELVVVASAGEVKMQAAGESRWKAPRPVRCSVGDGRSGSRMCARGCGSRPS